MSVANVNIRRDVEDKFYRYKMPDLLTKIEGRGNGIKTVLPNMLDVAKALARPPKYPTKFFGYELGAQTTFTDDKHIVTGEHTNARMKELLDDFIAKFVLCTSCLNPETDLVIMGSGKTKYIIRDCKACGAKTDVNKTWKLNTFILNNPPPKAMEQYAKANKQLDKNKADAEADVNDDPNGNGRSTRNASDEEVDDMAALSLGPDVYEVFGKWCKENYKTATADDVLEKALELEIEGKHKTAQIAMQALFDMDVVKQIKVMSPALRSLVVSEKAIKALLGGLEILLREYPDLMPSTSTILMALYHNDVFDRVEDFDALLKHWSTHITKKYVDKETCKVIRFNSIKFFTWLDEADEETEEEDEDED